MADCCKNCKHGHLICLKNKRVGELSYIMCLQHKHAIHEYENFICQDHVKGECDIKREQVREIFAKPKDWALHRKNEELARKASTKEGRYIATFGNPKDKKKN